MDPNTVMAEAIGLFQAGKLLEAETLIESAADTIGPHPDVFRLRALIASDLGQGQRALMFFREAARLAPGEPRHQFNLGEQARVLGDGDTAIAAYRAGLARDPAAYGPRLALIMLIAARDGLDAAAPELATARAMAENHAEALRVLAPVYEQLGLGPEATACWRRLLALKPGDFDALAHLRRVSANIVPAWHFPMMNDPARNQAYRAAITRAVRPDMRVFEIGTGAGLLALYAATAGARVTTCEMIAPIAEAAREIFARNRLDGRITLHAKRSQEIAIGPDMPEPAQLLISEIVSSALLGEGVLDAVADARARLLAPGAPMIPRAIGVVGRLAGGDMLARDVSVGMVDGFDLSPFNRFAPPQAYLDLQAATIDTLSDDFALFRFDLTRDVPRGEEAGFAIRATRDGVCCGVLQWLRLELDETATFENRPGDDLDPSGWKHVLHTFPEPVRIAAGQVIRFRVRHNRVSLAVAFDGVAPA